MTNIPPTPPDPNQPPGAYPYAPPTAPLGHPGHPGQHATPPRRKSKTGLIIGIVAVVLVAICGIGGVVAVLVAKPAADKAEELAKSISELQVGDCVKPSNIPDQYESATCSNKNTVGKVIKTFPGTQEQGQDCPAESDLLLHDAGVVSCVRSTTGTRDGKPGAGGGVFVAGDCLFAGPVTGNTREYKEIACADPKVYEKVTARVEAATACTAPATRFLEVGSTKGKVICLADGPGIAGPGECFGNLETAKSFDAVPCSAATAGTKVLARKATKEACENVPGLTHWIEDNDGLPAGKVLCLQKLR